METKLGTDAAEIAARFVAARRDAAPLEVYPGTMPVSLNEAYAIQDAAMALSKRHVAGWKVGKIAPPVDASERLAGPIFDDQVVDGRVLRDMPVFAEGFAAAEAEFVLRIGCDADPTKRHYSMQDAISMIDAVHVGIEIASSPFAGINDHGPGVTISDFGNNNGLVVGAVVQEWRDADIASWPVTLLINGEAAGMATAATMLDGPFGAARFLFELMAERRIPLRAGQWISTGAVTGVHRVAVGDRVEGLFDNRYRVACGITAY